MIRRILLHCAGLERITILEREDGLVLRAMVFINPMNVAKEWNPPDEQQEQGDPDNAIDQVEDDLLAENGIYPLQFGGRQ